MNTTTPAAALAAPKLSDQLGPLVEAAGMVNFLNHGAASHVHSEGCHGVTQEHLERFAQLLLAAERERCAALVEPKPPMQPSDQLCCCSRSVMFVCAVTK
jgi:hypothetical protein